MLASYLAAPTDRDLVDTRDGVRAPVRAWRNLGARARIWRVVHATWSAAQLASLALIWSRVLTRRRDHALWASVGFVVVEGGALLVGRGNCPMGRIQEEWGDPVPFFELLLPPRAAKAAIPILAVASVAAIAGVVFRAPGLVARAPSDSAPARTALRFPPA